ncbi:MAG: glutaminyl-peptide cyclotransferase [Parachlamydiaceae bacterium]|nr:glutaminyl-peptide cyclotransferase [Parachlamydiaceae bacterium]
MLPHDTEAFTQGLAISEGVLYESTGLYGSSSLRKIDLKTGKIIEQVNLPPQYFAEGIAIIDNNLMQVTWREQTAFIYDKSNLKLIRAIPYRGEGWGLCSCGNQLLMTNGSYEIVNLQSNNMQVVSKLNALSNNKKIFNLNDIESVGDSIYANIWNTDIIVRLDKKNGCLTGIIDASGLLTREEKNKATQEGVLNGIAYNPIKQTFIITGKRWPWLFEVIFVPK